MWPKSASRMPRIKVAASDHWSLAHTELAGRTNPRRRGRRKAQCGSLLNEWAFNLLGDKVTREKLVKTMNFL